VAGHGNASVIDLDKYGKHSGAILLASLRSTPPGSPPPPFFLDRRQVSVLAGPHLRTLP